MAMQLNEADIKKIEVFHFGRLQELLTMTDFLVKNNISIDQVRAYVEEKKRALLKSKIRRSYRADREWREKAPKCPVCGSVLLLREISIPPGRGNEYAYRSEWFCGAQDCVYEKYSALDAAVQLDKYGLRRGSRFIRRCNRQK